MDFVQSQESLFFLHCGLQLNIGKKEKEENDCKLFCSAALAYGSLLLIHKGSIRVYIETIHHTCTALE